MLLPPVLAVYFSFLAPCPASGLFVHGQSDDEVPEAEAAALTKKLPVAAAEGLSSSRWAQSSAKRDWYAVVVYEADKFWPDYHRAHASLWVPVYDHYNHRPFFRVEDTSVLSEIVEEMWNWDPEEDPEYERRPLKARWIRGAFAAAANGSATEDQVAVVRAIAALVDLDTLAVVSTKRSPRS